MTYVSVITLVTYALVLGLLAVVSVIDIRSRRVPNGLAAALGFLWVAWRVVLGFAGAHMGLGFRAEFLGPAPDVLVPPGLEIGGISFASGLLGAVVLGGGLLVLTTLYELIRRKEAFGGGDIKLMAAAGLFLGWQNTLLAMFFGIVFGGIYGIYLLAAKKAGKKDHFAFGPFLCAGIVIAMLFGGPVLEWYCAFL